MLPSLPSKPVKSVSSNPLRLAAIDIGTNSVHMILVELRPDLSFHTIDRAKDMVRIGEGSITTKVLTRPAMDKGIETLIKFRKLAEAKGVDLQHIVATATSAVREARNGGDFMELVQAKVGIKTRIITGKEEARLIYIAVRRAIEIGSRKALIIDVGGGSVEFIVGDGRKAYLLESKKLGVARMAEHFNISDPITQKERRLMEDYFCDELRPVVKAAKAIGYDFVIASSGTAEAMATMIALQQSRSPLEGLNNYTFTRAAFRKVYEKALPVKTAQRKLLRGLDPKRADLIVPGLVLFDVMLRLFETEEVVISAFALREGIVIDYLQQHSEEFRMRNDYPDVRRRNVMELAARCLWDETRSIHVATMALKLFDELQPAHALSPKERELLEYAALLHNIGYFISASSHHKHSYYLIANGELKGFHPDEVQVMANVARYHRRSLPKNEHPNYHFLSVRNKYIVRVLASILRVADGLDRGHNQNVRSLAVKTTSEKIEVRIKTAFDPEIEIWGATRKSDLMTEVFAREITVRAEEKRDEGNRDAPGKPM
ncbi:MAG: Ppx/GppA family phosphatase [Rhizobacter sp.]|nr:Ppx/GppA family phosphatase [Chlorobiales bacterium]